MGTLEQGEAGAVAPALYVFEKNKGEQVRAALTEWRGHQLADLRVHYRNPATGEWHPTGKGLAISRALLPELEAAVRALRAAVEAGEG